VQVILVLGLVVMFADEAWRLVSSRIPASNPQAAAGGSSVLISLGLILGAGYLCFRILRDRTVVLIGPTIRVGSLVSRREFPLNTLVDVYWVQKPDRNHTAEAVAVFRNESGDSETFYFSPRSEEAFDCLRRVLAKQEAQRPSDSS
jgi:hypothetical protein